MRYTIASETDRELDGSPIVWRAYSVEVDEYGEQCWHYVEGTSAYTGKECQELLSGQLETVSGAC
jgi:hypothetical protein